MKLCTDKVVADWLGLTPKRVKQLRDKGVLTEKSPGLYDLRTSVLQYVHYIREGNRADLNEERAMLTRAKREAADMENDLRRGTLLSSENIEKGIKTICLNIRAKLLALPAKLSPRLSQMGGDQAGIYDELKQTIDESLEELSDYNIAMAISGGEDDEEADEQSV